MASQPAPLVSDEAGRSILYSRHSQRYRGSHSLLERPKPESYSRKDAASACIDLTAYGEMNDTTEELLVSPVSDDKVQVRSLSNCENEASVAVENIKNLLEHGQTEQVVSGSVNRSRVTEIPKSKPNSAPQEEPPMRESLPSPSKMDDREQPPSSKIDREELWIPDLSLPSEEDQSISVYEMTKARLTRARRSKAAARRLQSTDMEHLTKKHEQLIQKSSEYKNNSSSLIEIIHIENDHVVPSPKATAPNHRVVDLFGKDLLSSMMYDFDKNDNGKLTDIIVIDDIVSEKGKKELSDARSEKSGNSRYDTIKVTRSGRLNFEKTKVHPLSPFLPRSHGELRRESQDSTVKSLNSIRDQVRVLQQSKTSDDPIDQKMDKDFLHLKSENEEIDSLIVCVSSQQSLKSSADSVDIPNAKDMSGAARNENPTTNGLVSAVESGHAEQPLRAESGYRKTRKTDNEIVDLNGERTGEDKASESNEMFLDSGYPSEAANNLGGNEKILQFVESRSDAIRGNAGSGRADTEEAVAATPNDTLELGISNIIPQDALSSGITASDLCIGFCSKNGDDSVSLLESQKPQFPMENLENNSSKNQSSGYEDSGDKLSTCSDQASRDSTNRIRDDTSLTNEKDHNVPDQDSEPQYNRDFAISAEQSSSSYPSDVEIDDDVNPAEEFERDTTIVLHSMVVDPSGLAAKTKNVKIVLPVNSISKKDGDVSTSDNGSTVTENTRVSLGDSENTDSDLDDEPGLYDTCFARQLLDATCGWLDKEDMPFCFQPSLLKKVKRREVGTRSQHYGRSPLLLRVPRNQNLSRTNIDSRRKFAEKVFFRSKRSSPKEVLEKKDHHQRFSRSRRNQNIFGSNGDVKDGPSTQNKSKDVVLSDVKSAHEVNGQTKLTNKTAESQKKQVHKQTEQLTAGLAIEHKNLGIFEVKSADECKSFISTNVERVLRARSLSPTIVTNDNIGKNSLVFTVGASEATVLPSDVPPSADEIHFHSRNKSRRESLAKLRRHHPERLEFIERKQEESGLESIAADTFVDDQRVSALELAEKLRRRAITLKRRRQIRERRKELRCTDSEMVSSPIDHPEIKC